MVETMVMNDMDKEKVELVSKNHINKKKEKENLKIIMMKIK